MPDPAQTRHTLKTKVALFAGPLVAILLLVFLDLDPDRPELNRMAAVAFLMAFWWITEAIPLAATSLLPIVLFPMLGIMNGKKVSTLYYNDVIFLFIGGFMIALAMERWNLHRRIALRILLLFGLRPRNILLGFMVATAFLSMWISNTATTMMMVPIVMAIIVKMEDMSGRENMRRYSIGLLLGVAYGASIGGIATLVGTPPNMAFARNWTLNFPQAPEISFAQWFLFAAPIAFLFLIIVWGFLTVFYSPRKGSFKLELNVFRQQYHELGKMVYEERVILLVFILMVCLWMLRANIEIGSFTILGWTHYFSWPKYFNDGTVSIAMALLLFMIPSRERGKRLMDWETAAGLPWGIILLFGGGFALAGGFLESGLSAWLVTRLGHLELQSPMLLIAIICLLVTFLTELTSNTATAEMLLPIMAALAVALKMNPIFLMIPATLSCSFAFMLPVATPPNAIVFGTSRLRIADMARAGIVLNLLGVVVITVLSLIMGKLIFGMEVMELPDWAQTLGK
jgi:solute carrier family 13 (sodium-dependent dicarboxylate transporter), member 2/3/5